MEGETPTLNSIRTQITRSLTSFQRYSIWKTCQRNLYQVIKEEHLALSSVYCLPCADKLNSTRTKKNRQIVAITKYQELATKR